MSMHTPKRAQQAMPAPKLLLSPAEAARVTSVSQRLLSRLVSEGLFPAPRRVSVGRVAFVAEEVRGWVAGLQLATLSDKSGPAD